MEIAWTLTNAPRRCGGTTSDIQIGTAARIICLVLGVEIPLPFVGGLTIATSVILKLTTTTTSEERPTKSATATDCCDISVCHSYMVCGSALLNLKARNSPMLVLPASIAPAMMTRIALYAFPSVNYNSGLPGPTHNSKTTLSTPFIGEVGQRQRPDDTSGLEESVGRREQICAIGPCGELEVLDECWLSSGSAFHTVKINQSTGQIPGPECYQSQRQSSRTSTSQETRRRACICCRH